MRRLVQIVVAIALLAGRPASASEVAILQNGFSIRHESREALGAITRLHIGSGYVDVSTDQIVTFERDDSAPATVNASPAEAPNTTAPLKAADINELVSTASGRHLVDPDLITSVIHAESSFNPHAISPKGAQGLMQLMPQTASRLGVQDAFEPTANVDAGTRYLRELLLRYNGNMAKALAAYNAGPNRVEQYRGVPPYRETHAYVARVIRDFNQKKLASQRSAKPVTKQSSSRTRTRTTSDKKTQSTPAELRTISAAGSSR